MAAQLPQDAGGNGVAVEVLDNAVAIRPTGEIDIDTAPALRRALCEALAHASAAKPVAVDCSGLTFCDSSALNALLTARRTAQEGPAPSSAWRPPATSSSVSWRSPARGPSSLWTRNRQPVDRARG
ncbi:STAS domain-containing protein [Streptomyces sp. NPDC047976]|uniref:STAS domain-containing protein n=1 Tax=Streptomyces sp. NPDC047976 TaxID=3155746 RepID=UPI00342AAE95